MKLQFNYDESSDVLYISFGNTQVCHDNNDIESGIIIKKNQDKMINGITIIDFSGRCTQD